MSRYQVTELFGYRTGGGGGGGTEPGLSVHVIGTLWNRRIMASWRSEDFIGHNRAERKLRARRAARALCDQLNAQHDQADRAAPHKWHGWVGGNEDLRCPGVPDREP